MKFTSVKFFLMVLTLYISANFFANAAESGDDIAKDMCAKLPLVIKKGDESYKAGEYAKARDYFTEQVSLSEGCGYVYGKPDQTATITAYNNVALSYIM